jgi:Cu/Ag efflux protein CusF
MKLSKLTGAALLTGLALGTAATARAQSPGETIEGTLTHIELRDSPRHIKVRWSGGEVQQQIANRTHLVFDNSEVGYFPNQELSDLKPGMSVKFKYTDGVLDRLYITEVPANLRPPIPNKTEAPRSDDSRQSPFGGFGSRGSSRRELKVRIESVDERRGEFRADVAGRRETFRLENRRDARDLEEGALAVIVVENRNGDDVVTEVRTASQSGRVVRIGRRDVVLNVNGREETYGVDDRNILDDLHVGDRIRFEFEDRSGGRKVITSIR